MKNIFFKSFISMSLLFLSSCHFPAKMAIEGEGGRNAYNIEVQRTNAEEMLLNLVRLRYFDSPLFLEVSTVTASFLFRNTASASIPIPGFNKLNPLLLGGESQWQSQPTIQYSPLEGQEFASQLMNPLDAATLQQVIYSGWEINRVFQLAVQDLKDFHNFSKEGYINKDQIEKYEDFYKSIQLMTDLQKKGCLKVGIIVNKKNDEKDIKTEIQNQSLQIAFPCDINESKEVASLLDIKEEKNGRYIAHFAQGFDENGNVGIMPRSILSCMYYLANAVHVPKEDIDSKKAFDIPAHISSSKIIQDLFKGLLNVCYSYNKPKDYYLCVKYRNKYFYIQDNDLNSKRTFMLLLELYNLQSGRRREKGPILTLPIGVG